MLLVAPCITAPENPINPANLHPLNVNRTPTAVIGGGGEQHPSGGPEHSECGFYIRLLYRCDSKKRQHNVPPKCIPYVNLPDKPLMWVTQSEAPSNHLVCVLICEKLKIHGESVCMSVNNDSFLFHWVPWFSGWNLTVWLQTRQEQHHQWSPIFFSGGR